MMANRILGHASDNAKVEPVVGALVQSIRTLVHDTRALCLTKESRERGDEGSESVNAVAIQLEARIAHLISMLATMHEAVVVRDAARLGGVVEEAEGVLEQLVAAREVELMLTKD